MLSMNLLIDLFTQSFLYLHMHGNIFPNKHLPKNINAHFHLLTIHIH